MTKSKQAPGTMPARGMRIRRAGHLACGLTASLLAAAAVAQAPGRTGDAGPTVLWTPAPVAVGKTAHRVVITLRGAIREGWHVYALKQAANGPTPLVVAIERNDVALAAGAPAGTAPTVAFEPAFGFATPYYVRTVGLTLPVRLRAGLAPGRQLVPVSIRYQACDGRICEPPKTVHLTAPVDIRADA